MSLYSSLPTLSDNAGEGLRFVMVQALFNRDITDEMVRLCRETLIQHGVTANEIISESVPGALEVPVALKWAEAHFQPSAMIALGCVIRGDTYHFEVVAEHSARAIMDLSLHSDGGRGMGIANGVLTCNTHAQALERRSPVAIACAYTAIHMALLKIKLDSHI